MTSRRGASLASRSGAPTPPTPAAGAARLPAGLLAELRRFILEARRQTARFVDAGLTLLYWQVGTRIRREVLRNRRADYGERIVSALSRQLETEFGRGFPEKSLRHMLRFGHRGLRRLIAIELKIGDFKAADAGPIELYLRWLDRHERRDGVDRPLGLILCAGRKRETVELLELEPRGIHVAEYLTQLPPREVLERRLHEAVVWERVRLEREAGDAPTPSGAARAQRSQTKNRSRA